MEIFADKAEMRSWSRAQRAAGRRVAFVPTMGALHEGHLSLVRAAHEHGDVVVASVYVNPTQFGPNEDFDVYPRTFEDDCAALRDLGCHAVFAPTDLYDRSAAAPHESWVTVERLSGPMCGTSRPGFFRGVATVVTKLFHVVEPDVAVFGNKDFQQRTLIERMVRDLDFGLEIVAMPIVREADGLALSSRNRRLSPEDRVGARAVPGSLELAEALVRGGERDADVVRARMAAHMAEAGGEVDYVAIVSPETLVEQETIAPPTLVAVAVHFGDVRLIDNRVIEPASV